MVPSTHELHLLSLSSGLTFHHRAKKPVLYGAISQVRTPSCRLIQVEEDILLWKVCEKLFDLQLWDWQKGEILWVSSCSSQQELQSRFLTFDFLQQRYSADAVEATLLNSSTLLLLLPEEQELRAFSVEHWRRTRPIDIEHVDSNVNQFVCSFHLPPTTEGASIHAPSSRMFFNRPATFPDTKPIISPDPSLSIICLQLAFTHFDPEFCRVRTETHIFLIHAAAIATHVKSVAISPPGHPAPCHGILWDDWGPSSTRILWLSTWGFPSWISTYGSRTALIFESPVGRAVDGEDFFDVLVLDSHPSADLRTHLSPPILVSAAVHAERMCERFGIQFPKESDTEWEGWCLRENVRTTLPFRAQYHKMALPSYLWPTSAFLTADGVAFVVSSDVADKPGGYWVYYV